MYPINWDMHYEKLKSQMQVFLKLKTPTKKDLLHDIKKLFSVR